MSMSHNNDAAREAYESTQQVDRNFTLVEETKLTLAARRMQLGQKLIIAGFVVSILGIILYCMPVISPEFSQQHPVVVTGGLEIIGLGVLGWLVGAVKYLNGAIDSNASDDL